MTNPPGNDNGKGKGKGKGKGNGNSGHKRPRSHNSDVEEIAPPPDPILDNSSVPKPKRLACVICRKRKLKCDGVRPSCSTCSRLGHACAYDEQRRKSGPKRGYVKALEERLSECPFATHLLRLVFSQLTY